MAISFRSMQRMMLRTVNAGLGERVTITRSRRGAYDRATGGYGDPDAQSFSVTATSGAAVQIGGGGGKPALFQQVFRVSREAINEAIGDEDVGGFEPAEGDTLTCNGTVHRIAAAPVGMNGGDDVAITCQTERKQG